MTEPTNADRAARVAPFLKEYAEKYDEPEDLVTSAQDFISDVLHVLKSLPADQLQDEPINDEGCEECHVGPGEPCLEVYAAVLDRAMRNFEAEVAEEFFSKEDA